MLIIMSYQVGIVVTYFYYFPISGHLDDTIRKYANISDRMFSQYFVDHLAYNQYNKVRICDRKVRRTPTLNIFRTEKYKDDNTKFHLYFIKTYTDCSTALPKSENKRYQDHGDHLRSHYKNQLLDNQI